MADAKNENGVKKEVGHPLSHAKIEEPPADDSEDELISLSEIYDLQPVLK